MYRKLKTKIIRWLKTRFTKSLIIWKTKTKISHCRNSSKI